MYAFLSGKKSLLLTGFLMGVLALQVFTPQRSALNAAVSESGDLLKTTAAAPVEAVALEQITAELKRGSNLQLLLQDAGISGEEASRVIRAVRPLLDLTRLRAGQQVDLFFEGRRLRRVVIPASIEREIRVERLDETRFRAEERLKDLTVYPMKKSFTVESSLYGSAVDAGIPENTIMDLIQLFSFDVDFQRDIQKGDRLTAVYELIYDEKGAVVDDGNILHAGLVTDGRDIRIYRYVSADGKADYFNEEGHTVRKTLLKTPIHGAYITSNFGMRVNPFSGYNTMHKGVDFGAPRGTAIKASGDASVVYAGYNEVYGNHVILRHVNHYETLYAHMTSFGRGIRRGVRVDQGQTIGYVGSTGMSTGPHLHYEVRYYGRQVNPSTVKFPPGRSLEGEELRLYRNQLLSFKAAF